MIKQIFLSTIPPQYLQSSETLINYMLDKRIYILVDDFDMYFMNYELRDIEDFFEEILFSMLVYMKNKKIKNNKK